MDDQDVDPTAVYEVDGLEGLLDQRDYALMLLEDQAAIETVRLRQCVSERLAAMRGGDEHEHDARAERNLERALVKLEANLLALDPAFKPDRVMKPQAAIATRRVGRPRPMLLIRPRAARATVCRSRPARRPAATRAGPGDDEGPPSPSRTRQRRGGAR